MDGYKITLMMVLLVVGVIFISMGFSIEDATLTEISVLTISGILSLDFFVIVLVSCIDD